MYYITKKIDLLYEYVKFKSLMRNLTTKYIKDNFSLTAQNCHEFLILSSRSFAIVILSLNPDLSHAVCVYYLVLRALDTIEDDLTIPLDKKLPLLEEFYNNLYDTSWRYLESQDKDKIVLEEFPNISTEFTKLPQEIRYVIQDICKQMGNGMVEFLQKEIKTIEEWEKVFIILNYIH
ncbi:unnamed protein product [Gordionus sp. m RMFG-2023]